MSKYVLVIDRGTSKTKAALYDLKANEVFVAEQKAQTPVSEKPGYAEHDMNLIWEHAKAAIKKLLDSGVCKAEEIIAIGFSGQCNGLFVMDKDGQPIRNAILSLDTRAEATFGKYMNGELRGKLKEASHGNVPGSQTPIALLRWLKDNEPENYAKIRYFFNSKDWVRFKLTGEICGDPTELSSNGVLNMESGEVITDALDAFDISEAVNFVPPVKKPYEVCGHVTAEAAKETGLVEGTPCVMGGHDMIVCSYGCGGSEEGHMTCITGTFAMNCGIAKTSMNKVNSLNSVLDDRYILVGTSGGAANCLDYFIRLLCHEELAKAEKEGKSVFDYLEPMVANAGPTSVLVHPFIYGGGYMFQGRGGINNLDSWTTRDEVIRAVYQGLAFAQAQSVEKVKAGGGCGEVKEVWISGGMSNSDAFCQMLANALNMPVHVPAFKEAACRGAAICALYALGYVDNLYTANQNSPTRAVMLPEADKIDWYQEQFALWKKTNVELYPTWDGQRKLDAKKPQ